MSNPNRYREVNFIGGRYLQARELNLLQTIDQGYDSTNLVPTSFTLMALFRQGGLFNVKTTLTGSTVVTFSALDVSRPVLMFIRDRFEALSGGELASLTLPAGNGNIYLNWSMAKITSVDDLSLVDSNTGEATAQMGELRITLSTTDLSGVALNAGVELSKNTSPIIVASYTGSGTVLVVTIPDPALVQAQGGVGVSGLVSLTGPTPGGVGVGTNDPRLSDARAPGVGTVVDASVRTPIATVDTNADGTPKFLIGGDPGGISAAKIIMIAATQTLEAGWNYLKAQFNTLLGRYNAHENTVLGLVTTHPFPTAAQVGAVPASHVGLPLNVAGSHPATTNQDSGGFRVNRNVAVAATVGDPAYAVIENGIAKVALTHDGDLVSTIMAATTIPGTDGDGPLVNSGALSSLLLLAKVVGEHVSKTSHKNPHGLTLADLGGGQDYAYIDTHDASTLASAQTYVNSRLPTVTLRTEAVSGGSYVILRFAPNGANATQNAIEIAYGVGIASAGGVIALPTGFNGSNVMPNVSLRTETSSEHPVHTSQCYVTGLTVTCHFSDHDGNQWFGDVNWTNLCWRVNA